MNVLGTHHPICALLILLMGTVTIGCKDLGDDRPTYPAYVRVRFKNFDLSQVDRISPAHQGPLDKAAIRKEYSQYEIVSLPLDHQHNRTTYRIYSQGHQVDTLTVHYKKLLTLISPQAGLQSLYTLSHVETTFSNYAILHRTLKRSFPEPDVEVYY